MSEFMIGLILLFAGASLMLMMIIDARGRQ